MRDMIFISHANPEDNEITRWLALQLAREGYPVWCDLTKLLGGEDFWMDAERALRERTVKFLFVLSRVSNQKPGTLKELALAAKVAKKEKLKDFIIPLRVDDLPTDDFNIEITRLNAIAFQGGWITGFKQLLKKLVEDGVEKRAEFSPSAVASWWREHVSASEGVLPDPELLLSNWYPIEPITIHFHELTRQGVGAIDIPLGLPYSGVRQNQFLVSFAPAGVFDGKLGPDVSIDSTASGILGETYESSTLPHVLPYLDERRAIANLLREMWLALVTTRKLPRHEFANVAQSFFFIKGMLSDDRAWYSGPKGERSWRNMVGYKTINRPGQGTTHLRHWHFALQAKATTSPIVGYTMKPHVLFSDDGEKVWDSAERLQRARRSQCKDWWNDDWRDRIAAAVSWLAGETAAVEIPAAPNIVLRVSSRPVTLESPVSFVEPSGAPKEDSAEEDQERDDLDTDDGDAVDTSGEADDE